VKEAARLDSWLRSQWWRGISLRNSRRPNHGGVTIIGIRRA